MTRCSTSPDSAYPMSIEPGVNFVDCDFPQLMLSAGSFVIGAGLAMLNMDDWLYIQPHAGTFEVYARDIFKSGLAPAATRYPVAMDHFWHIPKPKNFRTNPLVKTHRNCSPNDDTRKIVNGLT